MKQFTTHFPSRLLFLSTLLVTLIFSGLLVQTSYGCTGLSEGTKANFDMLLQEMAGEKVMGRLVGQVEMADFLLSNLHSRTEEGRYIPDPYLDEFNRVHTKFTQSNPADSFKKLYEAVKNGGTDERFGLLLMTPMLSTLYMKMYSAGVKAALYGKKISKDVERQLGFTPPGKNLPGIEGEVEREEKKEKTLQEMIEEIERKRKAEQQ